MNEEQSTDVFENVSDVQRDRLISVLENLEKHITRQNSLKLTFTKGLVYGVGTVIGASVLVALFGGVIAGVINTFIDEPVLSESLRVN
jgi:hypothetical protein